MSHCPVCNSQVPCGCSFTTRREEGVKQLKAKVAELSIEVTENCATITRLQARGEKHEQQVEELLEVLRKVYPALLYHARPVPHKGPCGGPNSSCDAACAEAAQDAELIEKVRKALNENPRATKVEGPLTVDTYYPDCVCRSWARIMKPGQLVTRHHPRCPEYDPRADADKVICGLLDGIEEWAGAEEGVPDFLWEAYKVGVHAVGRTMVEMKEQD